MFIMFHTSFLFVVAPLSDLWVLAALETYLLSSARVVQHETIAAHILMKLRAGML